MITRRTAVALLASPLLLTGCGGGAEATRRSGPAAPAPAARPAATHRTRTEPAARRPCPAGLGPRRAAATPDHCRQAVVVTGRGQNSPLRTVVLHERAATARPAHHVLRGWTTYHRAGDLHAPVGVCTPSDAGGLLADPGSRLPYRPSRGFREPGASPLDRTRPLGASGGGGIWFHVDHGGPIHGCVSLAKAHVRQLLRTLDPHRHPVAVMGHVGRLAG